MALVLMIKLFTIIAVCSNIQSNIIAVSGALVEDAASSMSLNDDESGSASGALFTSDLDNLDEVDNLNVGTDDDADHVSNGDVAARNSATIPENSIYDGATSSKGSSANANTNVYNSNSNTDGHASTNVFTRSTRGGNEEYVKQRNNDGYATIAGNNSGSNDDILSMDDENGASVSVTASSASASASAQEDESTLSQQPSHHQHHGHWGTPSTVTHSHAHSHSHSHPHSTFTATTNHKIQDHDHNNNNNNVESTSNDHHIPFVPNHHHRANDTLSSQTSVSPVASETSASSTTAIHTTQEHKLYFKPPDSFTFTAKITSNSQFIPIQIQHQHSNGHDHQNQSQHQSPPSIPYLECNNIGTTTTPITNHASFRTFPKSGAHPTTFTSMHGMILILSDQVEIQTRSSSIGGVRSSGDSSSTSDNGTTGGSGSGHENGSEDTKQDTPKERDDTFEDEDYEENDDDDGETRIFHSGDVIWVDGGEYKLTSPPGSNEDVRVLIMNIDKKYYASMNTAANKRKYRKRTGRVKQQGEMATGSEPEKATAATGSGDGNDENNVLFGNEKGVHSCYMDDTVFLQQQHQQQKEHQQLNGEIYDDEDQNNILSTFLDTIQRIPSKRVLLSSLGFSVSTFLAYFLSKVAPLQLAVGVGGACVVAGGTTGVVLGGEWLCDEIEKVLVENRSNWMEYWTMLAKKMSQKRRRRNVNTSDPNDLHNGENEKVDVVKEEGYDNDEGISLDREEEKESGE